MAVNEYLICFDPESANDERDLVLTYGKRYKILRYRFGNPVIKDDAGDEVGVDDYDRYFDERCIINNPKEIG